MVHFEEQNCFWVYLAHFTGLPKDFFLHKSNIFPQNMPLFELVEKKLTFCVIRSFLLRQSIFRPSREVFFVTSVRKCFKTSEKLTFFVCGRFVEQNYFQYYLTHLQVLPINFFSIKSKPFLWICTISNSLRKNNFLCNF